MVSFLFVIRGDWGKGEGEEGGVYFKEYVLCDRFLTSLQIDRIGCKIYIRSLQFN